MRQGRRWWMRRGSFCFNSDDLTALFNIRTKLWRLSLQTAEADGYRDVKKILSWCSSENEAWIGAFDVQSFTMVGMPSITNYLTETFGFDFLHHLMALVRVPLHACIHTLHYGSCLGASSFWTYIYTKNLTPNGQGDTQGPRVLLVASPIMRSLPRALPRFPSCCQGQLQIKLILRASVCGHKKRVVHCPLVKPLVKRPAWEWALEYFH